MFESKDGNVYDLVNRTINPDQLTWKEYDLGSTLFKNPYDMVELQLNLTDASLRGSSASIMKSPEYLSHYKVSLNRFQVYQDAYLNCKANRACSEVVRESNSSILNFMYEDAYSQAEGTSLTNEEWEKAHLVAEQYFETAKDPSSPKWFKMVD